MIDGIVRGRRALPPRIVIYGPDGIGKSSFAAQAESPIFIDTENGTGMLDVDRFPEVSTVDEVLEALRALYKANGGGYKTVIIDTIDWLESFIAAELSTKHSERDLAYGKGTLLACSRMKEVLDALDAVRMKCGMTVILIAHASIKKFESPLSDPYDRFQLKLPDRMAALVREWADFVWFATLDVTVKTTASGFGEAKRAISDGTRVIYTSDRAAFAAKSRVQMPDEVPLRWADVAPYLTVAPTTTGE